MNIPRRLIDHYIDLHRSVPEDSNDRLAYRQILIHLRNLCTLEEAREDIRAIHSNCSNEDRREIYATFYRETRKGGGLNP